MEFNKILSGYKTYLAAILLLLGAIGEWSIGDNEKAYEMFALSLAVAGIRASVSRAVTDLIAELATEK